MLHLGDETVIYLRERIAFCRTELDDLAEYQGLGWATYQIDRKSRRNVERIAENVCNAMIDISKSLLLAMQVPPPATYREVLRSLSATGVADEKEAEVLSRLAPLRNSLSHNYLDYRWKAIQEFMHEHSALIQIILDRLQTLIGKISLDSRSGRG